MPHKNLLSKHVTYNCHICQEDNSSLYNSIFNNHFILSTFDNHFCKSITVQISVKWRKNSTCVHRCSFPCSSLRWQFLKRANIFVNAHEHYFFIACVPSSYDKDSFWYLVVSTEVQLSSVMVCREFDTCAWLLF